MNLTALLGLLSLGLIAVAVLANLYSRALRAKAPKPRVPPERVKPAPYIGPRTYKTPHGEYPYEESTPDGHLEWAKVLLGKLNLDEGAGYWHNVGHGAVVLQTEFTEAEIAQMLIESNPYLHAEAKGYDYNMGASHYGWVDVHMDKEHISYDAVKPYEYKFTIEVRGLPRRQRA